MTARLPDSPAPSVQAPRPVGRDAALQPLPAPGETPWWIRPLGGLTDEVAAQNPEWGWTHGGCYAFAAALAAAYGGAREVVIVWDDRMDEWSSHHAIVRIGDRRYDYGGVFRMPADGYDGFARARIVPPDGGLGYFWLDDEMHMDDDQLERLSAVFGVVA